MRLHPFQRRMLADHFAGTTETLILVPKKNGKSTLLAALALFHLVTTEDAECVIAAAARDQAAIMLRQARGFIRRSAPLGGLMEVKQREIVSTVDDGRIRILAADADTADGVIPTLALVDELHRHKSAELYGVFRDGLGPRDGRMITISTAGDDETSPLGLIRAKAYKLPHVEIDDAYRYARSANGSYVLHEWALSPEEDRDDMAIVTKANPAPWQTEEALRSRHDSPSTTSWQWARFACGVWLRGEDAAIQPQEWDALKGDTETDVVPMIGWDQGWKIDTSALVPLYWESVERRVVKGTRILEPPGDGTLLDERVVVDALLDLVEPHDRVIVVYDPNAGAQQMVQQLERGEHPRQRERNVRTEIVFVEHSQDNAPISLADARLMEAIRRRVLFHDGDEALKAHALNAAEKPLGGDRFKFDRPRRGQRRPIDALRALSMVHSVAVAEAETPVQPSVVQFM
jgi:phage terminase large subunit-like protein